MSATKMRVGVGKIKMRMAYGTIQWCCKKRGVDNWYFPHYTLQQTQIELNNHHEVKMKYKSKSNKYCKQQKQKYIFGVGNNY